MPFLVNLDGAVLRILDSSPTFYGKKKKKNGNIKIEPYSKCKNKDYSSKTNPSCKIGS